MALPVPDNGLTKWPGAASSFCRSRRSSAYDWHYIISLGDLLFAGLRSLAFGIGPHLSRHGGVVTALVLTLLTAERMGRLAADAGELAGAVKNRIDQGIVFI